MASPAQITANRLNAAHSTGPRTEAGKAASARNATKHNLTGANFTLLPDEDASAFDELLAGYRAEFRPATPHQAFLIDQMVQARWRLDRIARLEADAYAAPDRDAALDRLHRYRCSAERSYYRAKRQLDADRAHENETNPIERSAASQTATRDSPLATRHFPRNEPKHIGCRYIPDPPKPSIVTRNGFEAVTGRLEPSECPPFPVEKLYLQVRKTASFRPSGDTIGTASPRQFPSRA